MAFRKRAKATISIHALCEEGDRQTLAAAYKTLPFLSTPSARRATYMDIYYFFTPNHFYPRPLRGGRL